MLCKLCQQLLSPVDFSTLKDDKISVPYEQQDTLPTCPKITASADKGCQFCAAVLKSIRKRWPLNQEGKISTLQIGPRAHYFAHSVLTWGLSEAENGLYLLELDVRVEGHKQVDPLRFDMYADSASNVAAQLHIKRVAPRVDRADETCDRILRKWIADCVTDHKLCRVIAPSQLPDRIIDVGLGSETNPRLVVFTDGDWKYAALSHCWGPLVPDSRRLRLTSANVEDMRESIPSESMPQNFQDAVRTTRMLGLRYLWIDSLCIIQDSKVDWETEGAKMDDIYQNAYVTIAATLARTSEDGFLKLNSLESRTVIEFSSGGELVLQENKYGTSHWEEAVQGTVWNDRAWTMQERLLSRRLIHFSKHQMYWECRTQNLSETGELVPHAPITPPNYQSVYGRDISTSDEEGSSRDELDTNEHISAPSFLEDLNEWWYQIAAQYSTRKLSYPSDKFPALSGLAAQKLALSSPFTSDNYLCGIWASDIANGLLWQWSDMADHRCYTSRAPSWSWAKCDSQVVWRMRQLIDDSASMVSTMKIVNTEVDLLGANPYGEVKGARLHLLGKVVAITLHYLNYNRYDPSSRRGPSSFPFDVRRATSPDAIAIGCLDHPEDQNDEAIYCLQVEEQTSGATEKENNWSGLLIRKIDGRSNEYLRIGIYILCEDYLDLFDGKEAQLCVLR